MLIMREVDAKIRGVRAPLLRSVESCSWVRERVAGLVARRDSDVTDSTDTRLRELSGEKLLAVTVEAGGMLRVLRDVGESILPRANLFPVGRRKLVARVACQPLVPGGAVGKL